MSKLKSLEDLKKMREAAMKDTHLRTMGEDPDHIIVAIGMATCGIAAGARVTMNAIADEINKLGIKNAAVTATGCVGLCYAEPLVEIRQPGKPTIRYGNVDEARAREIVQKHIAKGELLNNAIVGQGVPS